MDWIKAHKHSLIAGAVALGFGYAAFRISALAAALVVGCAICVTLALKWFKSGS